MSLNYLIRIFFYTSTFYFGFCLIQIIFSLALILYITIDIKTHLRKFAVICCEYISKPFPPF